MSLGTIPSLAKMAERDLLSAIIITGEVRSAREAGLKVEHFEGIDSAQVYSKILEYSELPDSQGAPAQAWLVGAGLNLSWVKYDPAKGTVKALCDAVLAQALKRFVVNAATQLAHQASLDPLGAAKLLRAKAVELATAGILEKGKTDTLPTLFAAGLKTYTEFAKTKGMQGLESPWPTVNKAVKGFRRGNIYTLFAPPKNYKTYLMLGMIRHAHIVLKQRTLLVTSEMTAEEMADRLYCAIYQLNADHWRDCSLPAEKFQELQEDLIQFTNSIGHTVHIYSPRFRGPSVMDEIKGKILELNQDGNLSAVFWDGHYRSAASSEWTDVYDHVTRTKALSMDPEIGRPPFIISAQEGSKKGEVSMKAYAQESSALFGLKKTSTGKATLSCSTIRFGKGFNLELDFDFNTSNITEIKGSLEGSPEYDGAQSGF